MLSTRTRHLHAHVRNTDVLKPILQASTAILYYSFGITDKQAYPSMLRKKLNPAYVTMAQVLTELLAKPVQSDQLTRLHIEIEATAGTAKVFVLHRDLESKTEQGFNVLFINQDQKTFRKRFIDAGKQTENDRLENAMKFFSTV